MQSCIFASHWPKGDEKYVDCICIRLGGLRGRHLDSCKVRNQENGFHRGDSHPHHRCACLFLDYGVPGWVTGAGWGNKGRDIFVSDFIRPVNGGVLALLF